MKYRSSNDTVMSDAMLGRKHLILAVNQIMELNTKTDIKIAMLLDPEKQVILNSLKHQVLHDEF